MIRFFFLVLTMALSIASASAQTVSRSQADQFADWLDRSTRQWVDDRRASAIQYAVVHDDEVIEVGAYGIASLSGEPVDPDFHTVMIGSATKTFTALAVAQLLDQGLIQSIDDPVNAYLERVQLPDNRGQAVTVRHLLTHTAGFEDSFWRIADTSMSALPVSSDEILSALPGYARGTDEARSYSNYGTSVLGLMIEDITGQSYSEYLQESIFNPLGMSSEVVTSPEPPENLTEPLNYSGQDGWSPAGYLAISPLYAPAGAVQATGSDMAEYLSLLTGGRNDVLSQSARNTLFEPQTDVGAHHSDLGMLYFISDWNEHTIYEHAGGWVGFESMLLIVDEDLGIFINVAGGGGPVSYEDNETRKLPGFTGMGLRETLLTRLLGDRQAEPGVIDLDLQEYAGLYDDQRRGLTNAVSFLYDIGRLGMQVPVEISDDGQALLINQQRYIPSGPDQFRLDAEDIRTQASLVDNQPITFFRSASGEVTGFRPELFISEYHKIPSYLGAGSYEDIVKYVLYVYIGLIALSGVTLLAGQRRYLAGLASAGGVLAGLVFLNSVASPNLGFADIIFGQEKTLLQLVLSSYAIVVLGLLMVIASGLSFTRPYNSPWILRMALVIIPLYSIAYLSCLAVILHSKLLVWEIV